MTALASLCSKADVGDPYAPLPPAEIDTYLSGTLEYARRRNYTGWSKHDALNSPWLNALSGGLRIPRLCLIQGVMRAPVNLRGPLGVRRARNNKGIALFARALMDRGQALHQEQDLSEARQLLDWLLANAVAGPVGIGWGYPYPWQDRGFFATRHLPNRVVTTFVAQALMEGYEVFREPRYMQAVDGAVRFLLDAPRRLHDSPDQLCLSYVPLDTIDWVVMDVNMLVAAAVARHATLTDDSHRLGDAARLVAYVVDKQTLEGAWYYSHPARDSHITHDNYHTGFILDALHDYMTFSGDILWDEAYRRGLHFYRNRLFDADGAPRWMFDKRFPRDIHGSAQGILSFVKAASDPHLPSTEYRTLAHRVARWALSHMWLTEARRFAWQRTPRGLKTHDLLRWCQGWMARALANLLRFEVERTRAQDAHANCHGMNQAGIRRRVHKR